MADNKASSKTTKINLSNDITVNRVTYRKGQNVEVPENQAEDILRMDHEHNEYLKTLHTKRTMETNAGTISVGGGE